MASALNPKTVDPGYIKRWIQEGYALWSRAPLWVVMDIIGMVAIAFCVPNAVGISLLAQIPATALLLIELRVLDQHGNGDWSVLWSFFKGSLRDIILLTRDVLSSCFLWWQS